MYNETNRYTHLDNTRNSEYISKFHVRVGNKRINPLKSDDIMDYPFNEPWYLKLLIFSCILSLISTIIATINFLT